MTKSAVQLPTQNCKTAVLNAPLLVAMAGNLDDFNKPRARQGYEQPTH